MKTRFTILATMLLAAGVLTSCEEKVADVSPIDDTSSTSIIGKWKWIGTWLMIPLSETNPATPENTGIEKLLVFNADFTWYKTQNSALVDSGSYSLGRDSYTSPAGDYSLTYDSIGYYRNSVHVKTDYYEMHNDTLVFDGFFAGLVGGAHERWKRVK